MAGLFCVYCAKTEPNGNLNGAKYEYHVPCFEQLRHVAFLQHGIPRAAYGETKIKSRPTKDLEHERVRLRVEGSSARGETCCHNLGFLHSHQIIFSVQFGCICLIFFCQFPDTESSNGACKTLEWILGPRPRSMHLTSVDRARSGS